MLRSTLYLCLSAWLFAFGRPICASSSPSDLPNSIDLSYEFVDGSSSTNPLATIFYNPKTLKSSLSSWTPPSVESDSTIPEPASRQLLRILLPNGSSSLISLSAFNSSYIHTLSLHLSPGDDGEVFSAAVSAIALPAPPKTKTKKSKATKATKSNPNPKPKPKKATAKSKTEAPVEVLEPGTVKVELIPAKLGPTPKLNTRKPPVVGPDGKEMAAPEEPPEKSFLQKYWWVFLIVTMLLVTGGGDK